MWLLGSTSQVMMTEERLSPSARSVPVPGDNPATIHSIEAILGFKEDAIFHKSASYRVTNKVQVKEDGRNVIVAPMKKSPSAESFDSKWSTFLHIPDTSQNLSVSSLYCWNITKSRALVASLSRSLSSLCAQVDVAPAARPKRRRVPTRRTETANCRTTRTPRRNTVGTGRPSPLSSSMNWRGRLRSPTTRTCTAERSWRWKSTCRRSECRYVRKNPLIQTFHCSSRQQVNVESVIWWGLIRFLQIHLITYLSQKVSFNELKYFFGNLIRKKQCFINEIHSESSLRLILPYFFASKE